MLRVKYLDCMGRAHVTVVTDAFAAAVKRSRPENAILFVRYSEPDKYVIIETNHAEERLSTLASSGYVDLTEDGKSYSISITNVQFA